MSVDIKTEGKTGGVKVWLFSADMMYVMLCEDTANHSFDTFTVDSLDSINDLVKK